MSESVRSGSGVDTIQLNPHEQCFLDTATFIETNMTSCSYARFTVSELRTFYQKMKDNTITDRDLYFLKNLDSLLECAARDYDGPPPSGASGAELIFTDAQFKVVNLKHELQPIIELLEHQLEQKRIHVLENQTKSKKRSWYSIYPFRRSPTTSTSVLHGQFAQMRECLHIL